MILILAILAVIRASPLDPQSPPVIPLHERRAPGPTCDDPNGCRSLGDIIRSCILTILLCTWVSMHPNIPSPDERWPRIAWRRAGLMILALIAPEVVIGWALRQRQAAAELAEERKGEGWTLTHGFFAIMGGFMEYEGNQPIRVLLPEELESYSLTGNGDFPRVSKAEIDDRSKGDAISKAVVILQTSWFVTQCIARGVQRLPITELELATVAFAALNFVIYVLWWDKPQNVQRGVRVYRKRMTPEPIDDGNAETTGKEPTDVADQSKMARSARSGWPRLSFIFESIHPTVHRVCSFPTCSADHTPHLSRSARLIKARRKLKDDVGHGLRVEEKVEQTLDGPQNVQRGVRVYKKRITEEPIDDGNVEATRVNTFHPTKWVRSSEFSSMFLVATITVVFGSIHCIGWSFEFPSRIERTLWRVASLYITNAPILIPAFGGLGIVIDKFLLKDRFNHLCMAISWTLLLFLYVLSRLTLLVLPFLCLRSPPPAAFHVVHWVSFIPHV
ncbi:hypothetical protein BC827DRAFT_1146040 [Russula dissimulans]|nr:hypothetical protein BC827DRAFT_1146040 [Russula dissimulans]